MSLIEDEMEVYVLALIRKVIVPDDYPKLVKLLGRVRDELRKADVEANQLINERDSSQEMADKLAARIAEIEKLDIGEHTSGNCPWTNALNGESQEPQS